MSFKLTILGSSGAVPAYGRFPSAQFLEIQNRQFLVDCGEGAQMQMMRYQINFHRIDHIFISHLHGDHYLGLIGLIFTMQLQHRTNELHLYSHDGLDEILTTQFRRSQFMPTYDIHFHLLPKNENALIYEDDALTVTTIPLIHAIPCSGFLFREKPKPRRIDKRVLPPGLQVQQLAALKAGNDVVDGKGNLLYRNSDLTLESKHARSYAYCSDTAYTETLLPYIKNADLLYHEATFMFDEESKARETLHSTANDAALIARSAGVRRLLVGHFSARYKDLDPLLREARKVFPGTEVAVEGETYVIQE
ncbi:MAG TPA: ribonuclease Z [Cyclobacteriaceae bacterium]